MNLKIPYQFSHSPPPPFSTPESAVSLHRRGHYMWLYGNLRVGIVPLKKLMTHGGRETFERGCQIFRQANTVANKRVTLLKDVERCREPILKITIF